MNYSWSAQCLAVTTVYIYLLVWDYLAFGKEGSRLSLERFQVGNQTPVTCFLSPLVSKCYLLIEASVTLFKIDSSINLRNKHTERKNKETN